MLASLNMDSRSLPPSQLAYFWPRSRRGRLAGADLRFRPTRVTCLMYGEPGSLDEMAFFQECIRKLIFKIITVEEF